MITRRDITGLTVAVLGHAALLAAIYFWPWDEAEKPAPPPEPIMVTLADDVSLVSAAPDPSTEPPAQAAKGEEDVPPTPDPSPPAPAPEPETKPKPVPPKPNPDAAAERQRPDKQRQNQQTKPGTGRPKPGLNLDDSTLGNGPAPQKTDGTGTKSQATMTGAASQNINSAILRQIQPCADRQVIPAPEARKIFVRVQLTFNRDGSLANLQIVGHDGVDDTNRRYVSRVDDAVEAIFKGCTPIRGLPADLYDIPGGWKSRKFRYQLTD